MLTESRCSAAAARTRVVNRTLTRIADYPMTEQGMQRLRLKADGRIVELRDGQEFPLAPASAFAAPDAPSVASPETEPLPAGRDLPPPAPPTAPQFCARCGGPGWTHPES